MAATADANITLTELDFEGIKQGLTEYIRSKHEFKDYNFDGSALSTLLDVLAYNTHYSAFYANMVANEMFLDSSVIRDSVVSHAKQVGYVPASKKAAKCLVDVQWATSSAAPASLIISKGTIFSGKKGDMTYNFVNTKAHAITLDSDGIATASSVPIYEGSLRAMTFIYDKSASDQRFIIPQQDVDISHLSVNVQRSTTDSEGFTDNWELATDLNEVTGESKAYWVQEVKSGYYEVYFGDNALGQSLSDGNLIVLQYIVTNGRDANRIGSLDSPDNKTFTTASGTVNVVSFADGGGDRETTSNIKFYAPRVYQAQDRAVTAEDYKSLVMREYPTADSLYVWGGEEMDPPQYGKVFMSVKPKSGFVLTNEEKSYLTNTILAKKNMISVTPEIVDPEYLFLKYSITTIYNADQEPLAKDTLQESIKSRVILWAVNNLGKFDQNFRHSKFVSELDKVSNSILNTNVKVLLEKRIKPSFTNKTNYDIKFENPFYHPHDGHTSILKTTPFVGKDVDGVTNVRCYMDDDGNGLIRRYTVVDDVNVYIDKNVGNIDYSSGTITLKQFLPISLSDGYITLRFVVVPNDPSISGRKNTLLYFDPFDASALKSIATAESIYKSSSGIPRATGY